MEGKKCTKCGHWKPFSEFAKDSRDKKRGGAGYQSKCKACEKEYRQANTKAVNDRIKKAKEKRPEHYKALHAKWWEAHKEPINEARNERYQIDEDYQQRERNRSKEWYQENTERALATTARIQRLNRPRYNAYNAKYRQTEKGRESGYRKTLKRISYKYKVSFTPHERKAILDRDKWKCQECGIKIHDDPKRKYAPDKANIDHIIALVNGGNSEPYNLQTLCRECNQKKGARGQMALF